MSNLKLGRLDQERPVKVVIELSAAVHRDLVRYGEVLANETGEPTAVDPARLIAPMLARFMASDRGFAKLKRARTDQAG